jgi:hypothetical protein
VDENFHLKRSSPPPKVVSGLTVAVRELVFDLSPSSAVLDAVHSALPIDLRPEDVEDDPIVGAFEEVPLRRVSTSEEF